MQSCWDSKTWMASDSATQQSKNHAQISSIWARAPTACSDLPTWKTGKGAFPESACPPSTASAGPEYSQLGKAQLLCGAKWRARFNLPLFPGRGGHPWTIHQSQQFECQRRHLSPQGRWGSVISVCDQGQDLNYLRRLCHPSCCIPPASFPNSQTCKGCDCPPGTQRR